MECELPEVYLVNVLQAVEKNLGDTYAMLQWYWNELEKDGHVNKSFVDGTIQNFSQFFNFSIDKNHVFFVVFEKGDLFPVGHVHINGFEGLTGRVHFSMLKKCRGRSAAIAKSALLEIFELKRKGTDTPLVKCLIGVTPRTNKLACKMVLAAGYRYLFDLEYACYVAKLGEYVTGMVTIAEADKLAT